MNHLFMLLNVIYDIGKIFKSSKTKQLQGTERGTAEEVKEKHNEIVADERI